MQNEKNIKLVSSVKSSVNDCCLDLDAITKTIRQFLSHDTIDKNNAENFLKVIEDAEKIGDKLLEISSDVSLICEDIEIKSLKEKLRNSISDSMTRYTYNKGLFSVVDYIVDDLIIKYEIKEK